MIADGRSYLDTVPWLVIVPAVVLIVVTVSISRLGDWVSALIDPSSFERVAS